MLNYAMMSDDELLKNLLKVNERLSFYSAYSTSQTILNQLCMMRDSIQHEFNERTQQRYMKAKLAAEPEVRDMSEEKRVAATKENSRSKSQSDIIGRMRRTSHPSSIKDS